LVKDINKILKNHEIWTRRIRFFNKFHYLPRITLLVRLQLHNSYTSNRVFVSAYFSGGSVQEILTVLSFMTYQPMYLWLCTTYLAIKINIYIFYVFQNTINMPCGNFWLCHVSQFWIIINNHNGRWRSIFWIFYVQ
jgi:hypothetical protein